MAVFTALSGAGRTKTADAAGASFDTKKTFYIYADQNRSMTIDGKAGTDNALVNLRADVALKVTFKESDNGVLRFEIERQRPVFRIIRSTLSTFTA